MKRGSILFSTFFKNVKSFFQGANLLGICLVYLFILVIGKLSNYSELQLLIECLDATLLFLFPAFLHNYKVVVFYDEKKYTTYVLIVLLGLILFSCASYGFSMLFPPFDEDSEKTLSAIFFNMLINYAFIVLILTIYRNWKRSKEAAQAQLLLREMELKELITQIHPHFLFNTLNALYNMSLKNDPNLPQSMLRLSGLMRYLLDSKRKNFVPLSNEIEYLENYVALERIRIGHDAHIKFSVEGNISDQHIQPMIFLPFVENAFKHGVEKIKANALVEIHFDIQENEVIMHVVNSKPKINTQSVETRSGIGLINVKRRLEILYPDKYELQIQDLSEKYEVVLVLNLK